MITQEQYFSLNNRALSRSKIMDFNKCHNYFYRKHITGEVVSEDKPAFTVGGAVDDILTQKANKIDYAVFYGDRRTKQGKEDYQALIDTGAKIVSESEYDEIISLSSAVDQTTAWQDVKKCGEFQKLLQKEMKIGEHFDCLVGLPDHICVVDNILYITDLKTSQNVDKTKYYYSCLSYGYFLQAALYRYLALEQEEYQDVSKVVCRHLAVEKEKDIYRVKTYILNDSEIDKAEKEMFNIIESIALEKEFKKLDATWEDAELLGDNEF